MEIEELLARNRAWAERLAAEDPDAFTRLASGQQPFALYLGCSDSRVPPEAIFDLPPGFLFVHRNVANQVDARDLNLLSVLEFGLTALGIGQILVCGHEGCGGLQRALAEPDGRIADYWLHPVRELVRAHGRELPSEPRARLSRLAELNVLAQMHRLAALPLVQAVRRDRRLVVHGLVYDVATGRLRRVAVDGGDGPQPAA